MSLKNPLNTTGNRSRDLRLVAQRLNHYAPTGLATIKRKNPVTPPGIDPGTVRLVAQRLNHYATPGLATIKRKNPVTPPGIDPGTFRPVAQRLNHYATPGPIEECKALKILCVICVRSITLLMACPHRKGVNVY